MRKTVAARPPQPTRGPRVLPGIARLAPHVKFENRSTEKACKNQNPLSA